MLIKAKKKNLEINFKAIYWLLKKPKEVFKKKRERKRDINMFML